MDGEDRLFRKEYYVKHDSYNKFPYLEKRFSICDAQITAIACEKSVVRFIFDKGFFVTEDGKSNLASTGYIEFCNCDSEEFSCHIMQRKATQYGATLYGQPISLNELANLLEKENHKVEVFLELYDYNYLYWRGVLLPYKDDNLSDNIVIEIAGSFPVSYFWE